MILIYLFVGDSVVNIAFLHYSCPPIVGGVEEVIKEQALLLKRNFINVKIFAGMGGRFESGIDVEINPILSSKNLEIEKVTENFLKGDEEKFYKIVKRIERYLEKSLKNFSAVIVHNVLTMKYNLPLVFALHNLSKKIKVISWNHDSIYFYEDIDKKFLKEPYTILKKYNKNIYYVAISKARQLEFSKLYGISKDKIKVIKNGIDPITFFKLSDVSTKIILEEKLFETDFLMFLPSRLHPRKNIELAILVLKELNDLGFRSKWLITGAFDPHERRATLYFRKLKKMINNLNLKGKAIILEGYKFKSGEILHSDRIKTRDLYLISDILFLPSFQEGFGIPLLEASMIKLPIVCSKIPPFMEIGGDNVIYFEHGESPLRIAKRIIEFKREYEKFSFFRRTIKEYAWDNIFKRDLYPFLIEVINR